MCQRFHASNDTFTWANGAVGHRPGGPFDCLGPFAIVRNCPVDGLDRRYTVYAQRHADTYFSIPAATRIRGLYLTGFFAQNEDGVVFYLHTASKAKLDALPRQGA